MGVSQTVHRDPGQQIQVAHAVGVPDIGSLTPGEHALRQPEGVDQRALITALPLPTGELGCGWFGHRVPPAGSVWGAGSTIVPTPASVKISSSRECGVRPSITWACGTPPLTARRQASIFGTIPDSRLGSSRARASVSIREINESGSGQAPYSPATRSEEHTSELQSRGHLVCRPLPE